MTDKVIIEGIGRKELSLTTMCYFTEVCGKILKHTQSRSLQSSKVGMFKVILVVCFLCAIL